MLPHFAGRRPWELVPLLGAPLGRAEMEAGGRSITLSYSLVVTWTLGAVSTNTPPINFGLVFIESGPLAFTLVILLTP